MADSDDDYYDFILETTSSLRNAFQQDGDSTETSTFGKRSTVSAVQCMIAEDEKVESPFKRDYADVIDTIAHSKWMLKKRLNCFAMDLYSSRSMISSKLSKIDDIFKEVDDVLSKTLDCSISLQQSNRRSGGLAVMKTALTFADSLLNSFKELKELIKSGRSLVTNVSGPCSNEVKDKSLKSQIVELKSLCETLLTSCDNIISPVRLPGNFESEMKEGQPLTLNLFTERSEGQLMSDIAEDVEMIFREYHLKKSEDEL